MKVTTKTDKACVKCGHLHRAWFWDRSPLCPECLWDWIAGIYPEPPQGQACEKKDW